MRQILRSISSVVLGFLGSVIFIRLLRAGHTTIVIVFAVVVIIAAIVFVTYLTYNYWKIHKALQELKKLRMGDK